MPKRGIILTFFGKEKFKTFNRHAQNAVLVQYYVQYIRTKI